MAQALTPVARRVAQARYWLIWCKSIADQMPRNKDQTNQTYYAQGYRHACNDIAKALAEKLDEIEEEV